MEFWKDINNYEGLYQLSSLGRIKNIRNGKNKLLRPKLEKNGYYHVVLSKNNVRKYFYVHRLVYLVFIGDIQDKMQVDHIDNNKVNNNICNLQLLSGRDNSIKRSKQKEKTSIYTGVRWNKTLKKWHTSISFNKETVHLGLFKDEHIASEVYKKAYDEILRGDFEKPKYKETKGYCFDNTNNKFFVQFKGVRKRYKTENEAISKVAELR